MWVYFWALYSVLLNYVSVFVPTSNCFDDCSLVVLSEVWQGYVLFPQNALAILGLLWLHINFRIICSSSMKNVIGNLIGIALDL